MANQVFANMMEVSCKAANGKSVACFPDVCFTPPMTPATPPGVPIPYPNTGMASDTTKGSRTVKISGKEVMLKNKSYFKTSYGDEPGCAPKKGVITSKNKGKVYFQKWSMDVKVEGENVVRMADITTHNHGSLPGNTPPWPYIDEVAVPGIEKACAADKEKEETACGYDKKEKKYKKSSSECCDDAACQDARKCMLLPYKKYNSETKETGSLCCSGQTGHHLMPNSLFQEKRGKTDTNVPGLGKDGKDEHYTLNSAPCVCVAGKTQTEGEHGKIHEALEGPLRDMIDRKETITYEKAKKHAVASHSSVFKKEDGSPACNPECIDKQLDAYFAPRADKKDTSTIKTRQTDGATNYGQPKKPKTVHGDAAE